MANDTRALFCLIQDDPNPFKVTVSTSETISSLSRAIREERKNGTLRDVDAVDLVLWKVRRFSRSYPVCS